MKKDNLTILEFADTHITLLKGKIQRGQPVLTACEIITMDGFTEEAAANALARLPPAVVGDEPLVLIPGRHAVLKQISLPSVSDEEIQRMVALQIGHLGPFSQDEIVFDHLPLERNSAGYTKVLIVMMQKENIGHFLKALQKKNIIPQRLALGSQGVLNWFIYQKKHAKWTSSEGVMVMDVDHNNTEICFCRNEKLFFSRNIRFGERDLDKEKLNLFMEQIGLTIGSYTKGQMGPAVSRIIVIANSLRRSVLTERLEEYYRIPVDALGPLDNIPVDKSLALPDRNKMEGVSLARGLGFLLETAEPALNLMPGDVLDTQVSKLKKGIILKFVLMLFCTCFLGFGVFNLRLHYDKLRLSKIEQKVLQTQAEVDKSKVELEALRAFEKQQASRIILSDILRELYKLTPTEITFQSLNLDAQGNFDIQGYAITAAAVSIFQNNLVGAKLFHNVNLQYATKRVRFQEEYTEFKIVCQLNAQDGSNGQ